MIKFRISHHLQAQIARILNLVMASLLYVVQQVNNFIWNFLSQCCVFFQTKYTSGCSRRFTVATAL